MNTPLKVRLISFGYSLLSLVGVAIVGVFTSQDFAVLVTQHFGQGIISTLILLAVTEAVKHIRNLSVLKQAGLGGSLDAYDKDVIILI